MKITRREWIAGAAGAPLAARVTKRPNVVLIMTDDQGYGDLSLHGNPYLKTPKMDQIARDGVEFRRFYVSPVCAPTRSSLLTGRYHLRCGVWGVTQGRETMRSEEVTIAEALGSAGYRTALYGKWHLGEHYPYVPHAQGFQDFVGFRTGHWYNYYDTTLEHNGKPYPTRGYITDVITDHGLRFIDQNRANPFFLYLAYNAPHAPFQVPERYMTPFRKTDLPEETQAVYAMVSSLDENIGRVLAKLSEAGLERDTIVIFLTDNGPNGARYNCGLRARKGGVYEGGVRAPFFVRWPGRFRAGRKVDRIADHIDVYPTLLELCGVARPAGPPIDGASLVPLLDGRESGWPERVLFTHREAARDPSQMWNGAVRSDRYNLVNGKELYDVIADPGETRDIAAAHPEKAKELREAYERWYPKAADECGYTRKPIPAGYDQENPVVLPAPQSWFHGDLRFFGNSGYAHDWITGWTSTDAWVHWDLDVVRGGEYEVSVQYLCPSEDKGARVSVGAAGATVEARIEQATSMQPKPSRDVIKRSETYEMEWGTLRAGVLKLPAGKTQLSVRALSKPGRTVMDLKSVTLKRLG